MRRSWGFCHPPFIRFHCRGGKCLVEGKSSFSQVLQVITDTRTCQESSPNPTRGRQPSFGPASRALDHRWRSFPIPRTGLTPNPNENDVTRPGFRGAIVEYVIRWKARRALANEPASACKTGRCHLQEAQEPRLSQVGAIALGRPIYQSGGQAAVPATMTSTDLPVMVRRVLDKGPVPPSI